MANTNVAFGLKPINTAGIDSGLAYGEGIKDWLKEIGKLKQASVSLFGNS